MVTNVLVWPASSELGREVVRSLRHVRDVHLVLLDNIPAPKFIGPPFVGMDYHNLHGLQLDGLVDPYSQFEGFLQHHRIDLTYPCHDVVHYWLACRQPFYAVPMVGSAPHVIKVLRSKSMTYRLLKRYAPKQIAVPDTSENAPYPRFIKPDRGQGSRGLYRRLDTPEEYARQMGGLPTDGPYVVSEYMPGPEYTVDCFSSGGRLLWSQMRERVQTSSGISTLTRRVAEDAAPYVELIHKAFGMRGAWFVQLKERADGTPVVLEVAPRIAGGSGLALVNGVNLPHLGVLDALGHAVSVLDAGLFDCLRRPLGSEFYPALAYDMLIMDVDDTLLQGDRVNPDAVALMLCARHAGREVALLTRDGSRLGMAPFGRWASHLACQVVRVDGADPLAKVAWLQAQRGRRTVFVDDSFAERRRVWDHLRVPTFDLAAAVAALQC